MFTISTVAVSNEFITAFTRWMNTVTWLRAAYRAFLTYTMLKRSSANYKNSPVNSFTNPTFAFKIFKDARISD